MPAELLVDVRDDIALITLNRPESRNALSPELIDALQHAVIGCDQRDDVRTMVLTGADPAFCAGLDLKRLASGSSVGATEKLIGNRPMPPHRTPIIGAINGAAVTGGLELALSCDFLIASDRARFADTHARVGVMPGWGLTVLLPRAIGLTRARQMSFTGNYVDAPTALAWGLVNEVVAHDALLTRAEQLARDIATIPRANIEELRSIYDEVAGTIGAESWATESRRATAWMRERFDAGRLARERANIVERGRSQL